MDHDAVLGGVGISGLYQRIQEFFRIAFPHYSVSNVLGVIGRQVSILGEIHGPIPQTVKVSNSGRDGYLEEAGEFLRLWVPPELLM